MENNLQILKKKIIDTGTIIGLYQQAQSELKDQANKTIDLNRVIQEKVEKETQTLQLKTQTLLEEKEPLEIKIKEGEKEVTDLKQQLEKKNSKIKSLEAYITQLQADIDRNKVANQENAAAILENGKLKKQFLQSQSQNRELQKNYTRVKKKLEENKPMLSDEAKEEIAALKFEIEKLRAINEKTLRSDAKERLEKTKQDNVVVEDSTFLPTESAPFIPSSEFLHENISKVKPVDPLLLQKQGDIGLPSESWMNDGPAVKVVYAENHQNTETQIEQNAETQPEESTPKDLEEPQNIGSKENTEKDIFFVEDVADDDSLFAEDLENMFEDDEFEIEETETTTNSSFPKDPSASIFAIPSIPSLKEKTVNPKNPEKDTVEKAGYLQRDSGTQSLQTEVQPMQTEIPLQTEIQPLQTDIQPLQTEIQPMQVEIQPLQTEIAPIQTEIQPMQTEIQPLQNEEKTQRNIRHIPTISSSAEILPDNIEFMCFGEEQNEVVTPKQKLPKQAPLKRTSPRLSKLNSNPNAAESLAKILQKKKPSLPKKNTKLPGSSSSPKRTSFGKKTILQTAEPVIVTKDPLSGTRAVPVRRTIALLPSPSVPKAKITPKKTNNQTPPQNYLKNSKKVTLPEKKSGKNRVLLTNLNRSRRPKETENLYIKSRFLFLQQNSEALSSVLHDFNDIQNIQNVDSLAEGLSLVVKECIKKDNQEIIFLFYNLIEKLQKKRNSLYSKFLVSLSNLLFPRQDSTTLDQISIISYFYAKISLEYALERLRLFSWDLIRQKNDNLFFIFKTITCYASILEVCDWDTLFSIKEDSLLQKTIQTLVYSYYTCLKENKLPQENNENSEVPNTVPNTIPPEWENLFKKPNFDIQQVLESSTKIIQTVEPFKTIDDFEFSPDWFEVCKSLEVLAVFKGWKWTFNTVILSNLWTSLDILQPERTTGVIALMGFIGSTAEYNDPTGNSKGLETLRDKLEVIICHDTFPVHCKVSASLSLIYLSMNNTNHLPTGIRWFLDLPIEQQNSNPVSLLKKCFKECD